MTRISPALVLVATLFLASTIRDDSVWVQMAHLLFLAAVFLVDMARR